MKKLRFLVAYLHAGSMDLAVGVFLITLLTWLFDIPFAWWHPLLGATLTILPDFDIFLPLIRHVLFGTLTGADNHHKTWLHFPVVVLPVVGVVGYVLGGFEWACIAVVGVFAHYVHDAITTGKGGGSWLVRLQRTNWKYVHEEETPTHWVEHNWLKWSPLSIIETALGVTALVATGIIIALR